MADVAAAAGVSVGTVSRALRGQPGVSAGTRERILDIAAALSYVISPDASALARRSTQRVGVVVPYIASWFYSTMLAGIVRVLHEAELDVLMFHVEGLRERQQFFERLPTRRKVDAVIVVALPVTEGQVERLGLTGVHVVVAGGRLGAYPHVCIDDVAVGRQAVAHLTGLGHRRIALVRSRDHEGVTWRPDEDRTTGYRQQLERTGLAPVEDLLVTQRWGVDGGRAATRRLLALDERPTAVFAYSDEMAFGVLDQLRRDGVDVPGEMSVIGVDGHPMADLHDLTTIAQDVQRQGEVAARLTVGLLAGRAPEEPTVSLPTELVVRGSTGPVPA
jgi:DNA-binding LacI/PurR family transcriptional regulator